MKVALFSALAYFIVPTDMIPDVVIGAGYTDDAAVLFSVLQTFAPHITEKHLSRARGFLDKESESSG